MKAKDHYQLDLKTAATVYVVTDAEIKNFIKLDTNITADDTLITDIKKAAIELVEEYLCRKLLTQIWIMKLDTQPDRVDIPFGYVQSIDAVTVVADAGTTTSQAGKYNEKVGEYAYIWLKTGYSWTTTTRDYDNLRIEFKCGWKNDGTTDVPDLIKLGVLQTAAHLYKNRDDEYIIPAHAKAILQKYKVYDINK